MYAQPTAATRLAMQSQHILSQEWANLQRSLETFRQSHDAIWRRLYGTTDFVESVPTGSVDDMSTQRSRRQSMQAIVNIVPNGSGFGGAPAPAKGGRALGSGTGASALGMGGDGQWRGSGSSQSYRESSDQLHGMLRAQHHHTKSGKTKSGRPVDLEYERQQELIRQRQQQQSRTPRQVVEEKNALKPRPFVSTARSRRNTHFSNPSGVAAPTWHGHAADSQGFPGGSGVCYDGAEEDPTRDAPHDPLEVHEGGGGGTTKGTLLSLCVEQSESKRESKFYAPDNRHNLNQLQLEKLQQHRAQEATQAAARARARTDPVDRLDKHDDRLDVMESYLRPGVSEIDQSFSRCLQRDGDDILVPASSLRHNEGKVRVWDTGTMGWKYVNPEEKKRKKHASPFALASSSPKSTSKHVMFRSGGASGGSSGGSLAVPPRAAMSASAPGPGSGAGAHGGTVVSGTLDSSLDLGGFVQLVPGDDTTTPYPPPGPPPLSALSLHLPPPPAHAPANDLGFEGATAGRPQAHMKRKMTLAEEMDMHLNRDHGDYGVEEEDGGEEEESLDGGGDLDERERSFDVDGNPGLYVAKSPPPPPPPEAAQDRSQLFRDEDSNHEFQRLHAKVNQVLSAETRGRFAKDREIAMTQSKKRGNSKDSAPPAAKAPTWLIKPEDKTQAGGAPRVMDELDRVKQWRPQSPKLGEGGASAPMEVSSRRDRNSGGSPGLRPMESPPPPPAYPPPPVPPNLDSSASVSIKSIIGLSTTDGDGLMKTVSGWKDENRRAEAEPAHKNSPKEVEQWFEWSPRKKNPPGFQTAGEERDWAPKDVFQHKASVAFVPSRPLYEDGWGSDDDDDGRSFSGGKGKDAQGPRRYSNMEADGAQGFIARSAARTHHLKGENTRNASRENMGNMLRGSRKSDGSRKQSSFRATVVGDTVLGTSTDSSHQGGDRDVEALGELLGIGGDTSSSSSAPPPPPSHAPPGHVRDKQDGDDYVAAPVPPPPSHAPPGHVRDKQGGDDYVDASPFGRPPSSSASTASASSSSAPPLPPPSAPSPPSPPSPPPPPGFELKGEGGDNTRPSRSSSADRQAYREKQMEAAKMNLEKAGERPRSVSLRPPGAQQDGVRFADDNDEEPLPSPGDSDYGGQRHSKVLASDAAAAVSSLKSPTGALPRPSKCGVPARKSQALGVPPPPARALAASKQTETPPPLPPAALAIKMSAAADATPPPPPPAALAGTKSNSISDKPPPPPPPASLKGRSSPSVNAKPSPPPPASLAGRKSTGTKPPPPASLAGRKSNSAKPKPPPPPPSIVGRKSLIRE
jgi:hypothetical protein